MENIKNIINSVRPTPKCTTHCML